MFARYSLPSPKYFAFSSKTQKTGRRIEGMFYLYSRIISSSKCFCYCTYCQHNDVYSHKPACCMQHIALYVRATGALTRTASSFYVKFSIHFYAKCFNARDARSRCITYIIARLLVENAFVLLLQVGRIVGPTILGVFAQPIPSSSDSNPLSAAVRTFKPG